MCIYMSYAHTHKHTHTHTHTHTNTHTQTHTQRDTHSERKREMGHFLASFSSVLVWNERYIKFPSVFDNVCVHPSACLQASLTTQT